MILKKYSLDIKCPMSVLLSPQKTPYRVCSEIKESLADHRLLKLIRCKICIAETMDMLSDDPELYCTAICCVFALPLLRKMNVSHLARLSFTSDFRFSHEIVWP
ncbi:hypothetical protein AVEN_107436-1 [Araneus ventricosus]|uniref:Uncharacterized protein n=1 Tax=Araneus ventricosus TaxID=182803 RepID=A0A4Y2MI77_ARAVE|nr:hypothetical protein AVEN_107436-1 [Araneus ventricosus]